MVNRLILLLLILLSACSQEGLQDRRTEIIKIGVLPDQNKEVLVKKYNPLINYLAERTGQRVELIIPDSYADLLEKFIQNDIDLANFGAYTYLRAWMKVNAQPLVSRDIDSHFTSIIIVPADSPADNLQDLKDMRFAFGSRLSTSGHLMPRYYFEKQNIDVEKYFSEVIYSDNHDETISLVRDKKIGAGVINAAIFKQLLGSGRIAKDQVKIIWESPGYQNYVWATQDTLSQDIKRSLRNAFMGLTQIDHQHQDILNRLDAAYFTPVSQKDFTKLKSIIDKMNIQEQ